MIDSWSFWWKLSALLSPFMLWVVGIGIGVHIACTRDFENIQNALSNSKAPLHYLNVLGDKSFKWRCYLVCAFTGFLLLSNRNIRLGALDANDVQNFPFRLKRRMFLSFWLTTAGMLWAMIINYVHID